MEPLPTDDCADWFKPSGHRLAHDDGTGVRVGLVWNEDAQFLFFADKPLDEWRLGVVFMGDQRGWKPAGNCWSRISEGRREQPTARQLRRASMQRHLRLIGELLERADWPEAPMFLLSKPLASTGPRRTALQPFQPLSNRRDGDAYRLRRWRDSKRALPR